MAPHQSKTLREESLEQEKFSQWQVGTCKGPEHGGVVEIGVGRTSHDVRAVYVFKSSNICLLIKKYLRQASHLRRWLQQLPSPSAPLLWYRFKRVDDPADAHTEKRRLLDKYSYIINTHHNVAAPHTPDTKAQRWAEIVARMSVTGAIAHQQHCSPSADGQPMKPTRAAPCPKKPAPCPLVPEDTSSFLSIPRPPSTCTLTPWNYFQHEVKVRGLRGKVNAMYHEWKQFHGIVTRSQRRRS